MHLFSSDNPTRSIHAAPRVPKRDVRQHSPRWVVRLIVCLIATGFTSAASPAFGQAIDREYKFKAAYLYKFATYTKWPKKTFRNADSPFVIGTLGPDPVGNYLKTVAKKKRLTGEQSRSAIKRM